MDCPSCKRAYSTSQPDAFPRVLLQCGHTFCHHCIANHLAASSIFCFTCGKASPASGVETFPINQTLINLIGSARQEKDPLCKLHQRKIEIYCEKDHKLLCSQCIIHSHQHHRMCTVTARAERERATLEQSLTKAKEGLEGYRNDLVQSHNQQNKVQQAFLDCQCDANRFFKTVIEEIQKLQGRQIEKLEGRRSQTLKKLAQHREELNDQIAFMSQMIDELYEDLSHMRDAQFLMHIDKRNFIIDNCKPRKIKYSVPSIEFKKGLCLQDISRSVQEMILLDNNRNSVSQVTTSILNLSPSLKKQKEPAVLEVNLKEEYQKRKATGTAPSQKIKPVKKTISIQPDRNIQSQQEKVEELLGTARNGSINDKQSKQQRAIRQSSVNRNRQSRQFDSLIHEQDMSISQNYTPLSSVHSFMRSSRASEVGSFIDDTTLRNTFEEFSVLEGEEYVYHIGGLSNSDTQKYNFQTGLSERLSANHSQFKSRGVQCVYLRSYNPDRCLLVGGISSGKEPSGDIYQFSFKDHRITKSSLKLALPRPGIKCVWRQSQMFVLGGRIKDKPVNTFQKYRLEGKELIPVKMPGMMQAREQPGCCLGFDGKLYAIGGLSISNDATNTVERYIWERSVWESVKPMKYSRIHFAVVSTPKGIFAIGGHNNKRYLNEVQFFDLEEGRWIERTSLKKARSYHTAVLSKDYQTITVFGGWHEDSELDSIEVYDIGRDEWHSGGTMRAKRCLHTSMVSPK